jgi:hypothetical protein
VRESVVERALVRAGEARGVLVLKLRILGRSGFPDRICLAPAGRVAFVELKRPGEEPRPLQRRVHRLLRRRAFLVAVIDKPEDCEPFFAEWLDG